MGGPPARAAARSPLPRPDRLHVPVRQRRAELAAPPPGPCGADGSVGAGFLPASVLGVPQPRHDLRHARACHRSRGGGRPGRQGDRGRAAGLQRVRAARPRCRAQGAGAPGWQVRCAGVRGVVWLRLRRARRQRAARRGPACPRHRGVRPQQAPAAPPGGARVTHRRRAADGPRLGRRHGGPDRRRGRGREQRRRDDGPRGHRLRPARGDVRPDRRARPGERRTDGRRRGGGAVPHRGRSPGHGVRAGERPRCLGTAAAAAGAGRAPDDDLRELAACRGLTRTGPVPLRAEDALFLHAQTDMLCQQVGALLLLEAATRDLRSGDLRAAVQARIRDVPELRRKLEPARSRWLRPCWVSDDDIDMERRVGEVVLGEGGAPATLDGLVGAFFSVPSDPQRTPWEVLLVRGVPGGRTAVVVKVHHTLGDSNAIIAALSKLFDREGRDREAGRLTSAHGDGARAAGAGNGGAAGMPGTGEQSPQDAGSCGARDPGSRARRGVTRRGAGMRVLAGARQAARTMRGLGHLAAAGFAPASPLNGPLTSPRRRYVPVTLPSRAVASTARALDARMADLLLAVVAEALSRLLRSRGERTEGCTLRAAVPRAVRNAPARRLGNRSAAVALDLPIGPIGPRDRLWAVRAQMEAHLRWGEAEAAAFVMRSLNILPPPLQRLVARQVYQRRFFNLLVSVFPGTRRQHRVLGARIVEVYPVLALADGVGLAIGAMTWGRSMSIGILADAALVGDVDLLADYITAAFGDFQAAGQRAVG